MSEKEAPKSIWLQIPCRDSMSEWYGEITWSPEIINDDDTEYVRADVAKKQRDELLAAAERQFMADHALIDIPFKCTNKDHEAAINEHTAAHYMLIKAITSVKGRAK